MVQKFSQPQPKKWKSLLCRNNDHPTCQSSYQSDSWTTTNYCSCGCHGNQQVETVEAMLKSYYDRAQSGEARFKISENNFREVVKYYQKEAGVEFEEESFQEILKQDNLLFGVVLEIVDE